MVKGCSESPWHIITATMEYWTRSDHIRYFERNFPAACYGRVPHPFAVFERVGGHFSLDNISLYDIC